MNDFRLCSKPVGLQKKKKFDSNSRNWEGVKISDWTVNVKQDVGKKRMKKICLPTMEDMPADRK